MVMPNHDCYWSANNWTKVSYDTKNAQFRCAGTSLPVIYEAFQKDAALLWYSLGYGDVQGGVHENLLLVAYLPANTAEEEILTRDATLYSDEAGPLSSGLKHQNIRVKEFQLSAEERLRFGLDKDGFLTCKDPQFLNIYRIHLHDDCFALVEPVSPEDSRLRQLVHGVLGLHSYYLSRDVDWSEVVEPIVNLLLLKGELGIKSRPDEQKVIVEPYEESVRSARYSSDKTATLKIDVNERRAITVSG